MAFETCESCTGLVRYTCDWNFRAFGNLLRRNTEVLAAYGEDLTQEAMDVAARDYETNLDGFVTAQIALGCVSPTNALKDELRRRVSE